MTLLLALAVPAGAFGLAQVGSSRIERWLSSPPRTRPELPVTFDVRRGQAAHAIASQVEDLGLVDSAGAFRALLRVTGWGGRLHAGEYAVERPLTPLELADLLVSGRVVLHRVTVPEGLAIDETADLLAATGRWSREALLAAFRDPTPIQSLDPWAPDLEGYLFPETYSLPRGAEAPEVARAMVSRFREVLAAVEADSPPRVRPIRALVTLASLAERETALPDEHGLVASVFHNRLERGMKLECDPTVIHALKLDGLWTGGPLLIADLSHDSPYNTYVAPALPPGPICSVGEKALRAALNPTESSYLFFVASGDGGHHFAETEREHRRNVQKWRRFQRKSGR